MSRERFPSWPLLLSAIAVVHACLYLSIIPPWQAPDETAHFEASHHVAETLRLGAERLGSEQLEQQMLQSLFVFRGWTFLNRQPPVPFPTRLSDATTLFARSRSLGRFSLAYVLYGAAARPFLDRSVETQLYAMRMVSVAAGLGIIWLTFLAARLAFPDHPHIARSAGLVALFVPQHANAMATVNDGILAELLVSAAFYFFLRVLRGRSPAISGAAAAASLLGALMVKSISYALLPIPLWFGILWFINRNRSRGTRWRAGVAAATAAVAVAVTLLVASPQIVHYVRYRAGDLLSAQWRSRLLDVLFHGQLPDALSSLLTNFWILFTSFWMHLGWLAIAWPAWCYGVLLLCVGMSALGWVRFMKGVSQEERVIGRVVGGAALLPLAPIIVLFLFSTLGREAAQGRLLFISMTPLSILLAAGWINSLPVSCRRAMQCLLAIGLITLDSVALFGTAIPFFYGTGVAE